MASPREVYTKCIEALNARDFTTMQSYFAQKLPVNGAEIESSFLMQQLQGLVAIGPDMKSNIDFLAVDKSGDKAFFRVVHRATLTQEIFGAKVTGEAVEFAELAFFWIGDGLVNKIFTVTDFGAIAAGTPNVPRVPRDELQPSPAGFDFAGTAKSFVESLKSKAPVEELAKYGQDPIWYNGQKVPLATYASQVAETFDAIDGLKFSMAESVVDEEQQICGARLQFEGKLVKQLHGVQPTGTTVTATQHSAFKFDGGRISAVATIFDDAAFKTSVQEQ